MHGKSGTETPYHSLYDINGIKDIDGKVCLPPLSGTPVLEELCPSAHDDISHLPQLGAHLTSVTSSQVIVALAAGGQLCRAQGPGVFVWLSSSSAHILL